MMSSIQQFYQDCFVKFALMGSRPRGEADIQLMPCRERTDQDSPYAYGTGNPHAGNAGIPPDRENPPLPPRL